MKKYLICIPVSDDFAMAGAVLIHSLKKNLRVFDECDVKVVYNNLNQKGKDLIKKAHADTIFAKPKNSSFYKYIPKTIYGTDNYDVYLSFETFVKTDHEKCIYLDADMLCVNDFSHLIQDPAQIIWKYPNLGILIVGKKYLTGQTYRDMIGLVLDTNIKNDPMGDQTACRTAFSPSNPDVKVISENYNFQNFGAGGKGSRDEYVSKQNDVKVIHYSGRRKPWGEVWNGLEDHKNCIRYATLMNDNEAIKIWYKYYDSFRGECL